MARQLAAFPKKQFDMYRSKARILGSGEHFNTPLTPSLQNVKEKMTLDPVSNINRNILTSNDCKNDGMMDKKTVLETEKNQLTDAKSSKKKSKKKKKNKAACAEEPSGLSNGQITGKTDKDSSQKQSDLVMENKLLDPEQGSSRIATMNRTLVADISAVGSADSPTTFPNKTSNKISKYDKSKDFNNSGMNLKLENETEIKDEKCSTNSVGKKSENFTIMLLVLEYI
jgi:hypothetical protein